MASLFWQRQSSPGRLDLGFCPVVLVLDVGVVVAVVCMPNLRVLAASKVDALALAEDSIATG